MIGPFYNFQEPLGKMQAQARDILSNPEAAAQSLWTIQHSYATSELFKNVTTVRAEQLAQMYGKQWQHSWGILASSGDLVELDLMYMSDFNVGCITPISDSKCK